MYLDCFVFKPIYVNYIKIIPTCDFQTNDGGSPIPILDRPNVLKTLSVSCLDVTLLGCDSFEKNTLAKNSR